MQVLDTQMLLPSKASATALAVKRPGRTTAASSWPSLARILVK